MEDPNDMAVSKESVEAALRDKLQATEVTVLDTSGGCGRSFDVAIVSPLFAGKRPLERHRLVNGAIGSQMANIHALSIVKALTPEQAQPQSK